MAFVTTAAFIGGGSAILGTAIIGAGVGGAYSAITGDGDILNSMLTGGLIGGAGAGLMTAAGAGGFGAAVVPPAGGATGALASQAVAPMSTAVNTVTPAMEAASLLDAAAVTEGGAQAGMATEYAAQEATAKVAAEEAAKKAAASKGMNMLGYGLAGTAAMQLLGGRGKGAQAPASAGDPGMIRPFEYTSTPNEPTGIYPSPYATASYDASGNPIMDTRERNYFNQNFAAMQPYSAKTGTANPNIPLPKSSSVNAAGGGIMRGYDDELGGDYSAMGMDQGNLQKGLFNMGYASGGSVKKYGFGGLTLIEDMISQAEQGQQAQIPKYNFDQGTQRYSVADQPMMGTSSFGGYSFDPNTDRYSTNPQPMAAGGQVKKYAEGGMPDFGNGSTFPKLPPISGPLGAVGAQQTAQTQPSFAQSPYGSISPYDDSANSDTFGQAAQRDFSAQQSLGLSGNGLMSMFNPSAQQNTRQMSSSYGGDDGSGLASYGGGNNNAFPLEGQYGIVKMADGGLSLGDYSDGGRLLKGPGDGVSDDIPATIADKQPARLADGEFVIPARIVSEIGNGSTDAGAKRLYAMMDRIQAGRKKTIGKKNVAKDTKAKKHLLA